MRSGCSEHGPVTAVLGLRDLTHRRQPAAESLAHELEQTLIGGDLLLGNSDAV